MLDGTSHDPNEIVKEASGTVRVEIEALLSMGLANSPMAGARIHVASGNFVTANQLPEQDLVFAASNCRCDRSKIYFK